MSSQADLQTTTVRLPRGLYEQARTAVRKPGVASSLNDFLIEAIEAKLHQLREQEMIISAVTGTAEKSPNFGGVILRRRPSAFASISYLN